VCGGGGNSYGQIAQAFAVPTGSTVISFDYAASFEASCIGCGTVVVDVSVGGSCGTASVWNATLSACQPWTYQSVNLGGYVGCTATISITANSGGALCTFAYLDNVLCCP
jgi:hypothetical protein